MLLIWSFLQSYEEGHYYAILQVKDPRSLNFFNRTHTFWSFLWELYFANVINKVNYCGKTAEEPKYLLTKANDQMNDLALWKFIFQL